MPAEMGTVQTVSGPVDSSGLGTVLMHEHVITRSPGLREDYPATYPRRQVLETCVEALVGLKAGGIDTLIDHTTYDLGRDVELLAEVSAASGVTIVAATGVWIEPQRFWQQRAPTESAELIIGDIERGIAGTSIRAGVIKCATDKAGLTPAVERVLRACAIAHRRTGVYISTHSIAGERQGLEQQRVLADEGVDLGRVVIGHCGDTEDTDYLRELIAAGSYLGLDRFGVEDLLTDAKRMDVVAELCADGHADRLLLSHDASCWNDRTPVDVIRRVRPGWHHLHLVEDIVPGLRQRGVTDEQLETMTVSNPQAIFSNTEPYPGAPSAAATANAWD